LSEYVCVLSKNRRCRRLSVLKNPAMACPDHAPDQSGQAFGLAGLLRAGTAKTLDSSLAKFQTLPKVGTPTVF
jgi:hypothetical protein